METLDDDLYINKCRTCFKQSDGLQSLTKLSSVDLSRKVSYEEILKEVTNINLLDDKSPKMPRSICNYCTLKLESSHEFIKQAREVNDKLRSLCHLSLKLDCLQESEIDFQTCLEIKKEDEDVEGLCTVTAASPTHVQFKTEILDESSLDENVVNSTTSFKEVQDVGIPEMEAVSSKIESDISDDSNDSTFVQAERKDSYEEETSREKQSSNEIKDEDADIAVPCLQCNKIFNNSKELTRHLRNTHLPEDQKCACPLCGIKFTRSCNMYKHMRKLHDPESVKVLLPIKEKPFECDKCHRKYTQKRQLNCHIKEKHQNADSTSDKASSKATSDSKKKSEVRPLCFVCGSSFSNKAHLIVHMTRHTGEKPFKCDLCDRAFPRISDLTCHRRIHTGEKPFKCKLCEKAFRVSTKLATHMRSHTNDRPYKCKQCERSFKYSKDLNIHMRIHTGERPYCCTVCGSTFTQSNSLKAHRMKLGHMEDGAPLMHSLT